AVTIPDEADRAAAGGLRRNMSDRESGRAARETAVGDERALLREAPALQIAGRQEHLLHAGPTFRPLVTHDDDVAGLHPVIEDVGDEGILTFVDACGTAERAHRRIDRGGLHDAPVGSEVAVQHCKATIRVVSTGDVADTAGPAVEIERGPSHVLTE